MTDTFITLPVHVNITVERVKDLLCNAIEGGSTGWCNTMDRMGGVTVKEAPYRQDVPFVEGGWLDVMDDDGGQHRLDLEAIKKGLNVFAEKCPRHFADFMAENDDAETGDCFLQCCLFGEVIYG